jgi:hypothetical protein
MKFPWNERATLVRLTKADRAEDEAHVILLEGPLLALAKKVRAMKVVERRGLRMSLPDRHVRPHTFQDEALTALIESIPVDGC